MGGAKELSQPLLFHEYLQVLHEHAATLAFNDVRTAYKHLNNITYPFSLRLFVTSTMSRNYGYLLHSPTVYVTVCVLIQGGLDVLRHHVALAGTQYAVTVFDEHIRYSYTYLIVFVRYIETVL